MVSKNLDRGFEPMMGLLLGMGILLLVFVLGRRVLRFLQLQMDADQQIIFGTGLGLGLLAYGILFLGLIHQLSSFALLGILCGLLFLLCIDSKEVFASLSEGIRQWKLPSSKFCFCLFFIFGLTIAFCVFGVLSPETAQDSLCYHVHLPKLFLKNQSVTPISYEVNALFPFLMEMLYTLGLGIGGMALAKFFHFATGLLTALAILAFCRRVVPITFSWMGAILFFTTPLVVNQLGTTYVDVGLAFFTFLALVAILQWFETQKNGWLILAGIFGGFILSIKYLGLISILAVILIFFWKLVVLQRHFKSFLFASFIFGFFAIIFGAYWYIRAYVELGNPVYPYFYSIFKSGDATIHYEDIGVSKNLFNYFTIPWIMTMHPEKFEGFGVQMGPGYLAFLPSVLWAIGTLPGIGYLIFFSWFYLTCWFLLGQSLRFFLPCLPVLAVLIAVGLAKMNVRGVLAKGIKGLFVIVILLNGSIAFYHYRDIYAVVLGLETRDQYLARNERTYEVATFVNQNLPHDAKILMADETRLFYFDREVVRESIYAKDSQYVNRVSSPSQVIAYLQEQGFTHILYVQNPYRDDTIYQNLRISQLFSNQEKAIADRITLLYSKEAQDKEGRKSRYFLYEIK